MSIIAYVYCAFGYANPLYARTYTIVFITFASLLVYLLTNDKYCDSHANWRTIILTAFAVSVKIPNIHWLVHNWHLKFEYLKLSITLDIAQGIYLIGAVLYIFRVPERLMPGRFDIFLNSHQLFHICCSVAAILYHYGMLQIIEHFKTRS